ncbi:LysM peptidoglycan-binding domain-containing protein [Streptoalloteichus hindustanus]|uniref:LysM domain-containing protein n=1 Tax=Streptoalloteichus hindustanus TaxID=2017 RepID=A0A1M5B826_STRHI|nr:LysM peptidoglycan-binding domain-containing protein [Streptoalloteichus hindustanus]SHF38580.1 LysM domain-containing protein [Streptoalloteichus hindustanus]
MAVRKREKAPASQGEWRREVPVLVGEVVASRGYGPPRARPVVDGTRRPPGRPQPVVARPSLRLSPCRVRPISHVWTLVVLVGAACLAVVLLGVSGPDRRDAVPTGTETVHVAPGESVWDVARRVAPRHDPDAVVRRIRELNPLDGVAVLPGQALVVPVDR